MVFLDKALKVYGFRLRQIKTRMMIPRRGRDHELPRQGHANAHRQHDDNYYGCNNFKSSETHCFTP